MVQDDEDGGSDAVHCHDVTVPGDGEPRHDVDVSDRDLADEVTMSCEYLHPAPLIPSVTHNILSTRLHHSYFPEIFMRSRLIIHQ